MYALTILSMHASMVALFVDFDGTSYMRYVPWDGNKEWEHIDLRDVGTKGNALAVSVKDESGDVHQVVFPDVLLGLPRSFAYQNIDVEVLWR